ncbi:MAG TPA: hypothetical protein VJP77_09610 [Planctomycetota bacterium]|nr:hypothetical protein [Planctomycetota bacterium]
MAAERDPNLALLEQAALLLGPLLDELVLVGGCAAGLLVTDPGASPIRPTEDVDLLVEAATYADYHRFGQRLVALGFGEGTVPGDPLCRFRHPRLVLDLMPLDEGVLGFSNRWYASAVRSPLRRRLPSGAAISHIDAPHFLASKLEAFRSRGGGDYVTSADLEDVVVVIDGREAVGRELAAAPRALRQFVAEELDACTASRYFVEALPGYFAGEPDAGQRAGRLVERLRRLAEGHT